MAFVRTKHRLVMLVDDSGVKCTPEASMLIFTLGMQTVRVRVIIPVQTYVLLGRRSEPGLIARSSLQVIPEFLL